MTGPLLRVCGAGMVIAAGALLGLRILNVRRERVTLLRSIAAGLGRMADELSMLCRPLPELFERLGDRPFFQVFCWAGEGTDYPALWRSAAMALPLSEADKSALAELAGILGRYDEQRQAAELQLVRQRLTERADGLAREIAEQGRRLPLLGAAAGGMLAVLLL